MAKQKYYVVWKGRKTGVFATWEDCSAQVTGFAGAEYKSFPTLAEANSAFGNSYNDHVTRSTDRRDTPEPREDTVQRIKRLVEGGKIIANAYAVDAACEGNPGVLEYRGVDLSTGTIIFAEGPFQQGTNNIGEFLALVEALIICQQNDLHIPIYSDSRIAISWLREKKCKTKLPHDAQNAALFDRIARAEDWLDSNTYGNRILKWETEEWGENPADYGRK